MICFTLDFVDMNAEDTKDFISKEKAIAENLKKIFLEVTEKKSEFEPFNFLKFKE